MPTWRERRREKRRKRGAALLDGLVAEIEYEDLLRYEDELRRGLLHTPEKDAEMAQLRRKFGGDD